MEYNNEDTKNKQASPDLISAANILIHSGQAEGVTLSGDTTEEKGRVYGTMSVDAIISKLQNSTITQAQAARIKLLLPESTVNIHDEIESQYQMINVIKSRILDRNNKIHESATAKEIASVITGFNAYLSLYLRSQDKINVSKQHQQIEDALHTAIHAMPKKVQEEFLSEVQSCLGV